MSIIQRLRTEHPKLNPLFAAVENLKEPSEIKQFYREYVDWLSSDSKYIEGVSKTAGRNYDPEIIANCNIRVVLGGRTNPLWEKWMDALPEVKDHVYDNVFRSV